MLRFAGTILAVGMTAWGRRRNAHSRPEKASKPRTAFEPKKASTPAKEPTVPHAKAASEHASKAPLVSGRGQANDMDWHTEMLLADLFAAVPDFECDLQDGNGTTPVPPESHEDQADSLPPATSGANALPAPATAHATDGRPQPHTIGPYVVEHVVVENATGNTYKAWNPKRAQEVIIKTVSYGTSSQDIESASIKEKAYRQLRAITELNHPNIAVVHDVGQEQEFCYIVTEHLEGVDLRRLLDHEHRLPCELVVWIVMQACNALQYAHGKGFVHLDIKPENCVLLHWEEKIKVAGIGLAMAIGQLASSQANGEAPQGFFLSGTPGYMAPEQMVGGRLDARTDIFALGVVLYELLTGTRPFVGKSVETLVHRVLENSYLPLSLQNIELPAEFDAVIDRALDSRPEHRFQTAAEFREALEHLQLTVLRR